MNESFSTNQNCIAAVSAMIHLPNAQVRISKYNYLSNAVPFHKFSRRQRTMTFIFVLFSPFVLVCRML